MRGIYDLDLERFRKGIYQDYLETNPALFKEKEIAFLEEQISNKEKHLKASLNHITKGRRKQIVIFLDNADQRTYEIQQTAFLIAQELAEHWPGTVFVALRPETFHKSLRVGSLSGYHPKAFTIAPPRVDRVIEKRLEFALSLTSGRIPLTTLAENTSISLVKLDTIIRVFLDSLRRNESLVEFIDNIAGGNIRLGLNFVRNFFGSGHVNTEKIISIYERDSQYQVPLHEFLRAVMFGDAEYYDPDQSPIANLFDVSQSDPREHFLLPLLIGLLHSLSTADAEAGFVEITKVYDRLQGLGFTPEQIDVAIVRALKVKLIESMARDQTQPSMAIPKALRATTVGVYHILRLCRFFSYINAVIVDTPIFDDSLRESLRQASNIAQRLDRAVVFRRYLDNHWGTLRGAAAVFDWGAASTQLEADLKRVRDRAARRNELYGPSPS